MGCSAAMALLALCNFTLAGEPQSPLAGINRDRPAQDYNDRRFGGVAPDYGRTRDPYQRPGVIYVRPRG